MLIHHQLKGNNNKKNTKKLININNNKKNIQKLININNIKKNIKNNTKKLINVNNIKKNIKIYNKLQIHCDYCDSILNKNHYSKHCKMQKHIENVEYFDNVFNNLN